MAKANSAALWCHSEEDTGADGKEILFLAAQEASNTASMEIMTALVKRGNVPNTGITATLFKAKSSLETTSCELSAAAYQMKPDNVCVAGKQVALSSSGLFTDGHAWITCRILANRSDSFASSCSKDFQLLILWWF